MSSIERACYEDFQSYIPEITAESQYKYPNEVYNSNLDGGIILPGQPSFSSESCGLKTFPPSSGNKTWPTSRPYCYGVGEEPCIFKDCKDEASGTFENCKRNDSNDDNLSLGSDSCPDCHVSSGTHFPSHKSLHTSSNGVLSLCDQQICPTVSIRVDISCPLSTCSCNKISQSHQGAGSISSIHCSHKSDRSHGVLKSNFHQGLPGGFCAQANTFNSRRNSNSSHTSNFNTDPTNSQFKLRHSSDADIKPCLTRYEGFTDKNGHSVRESPNSVYKNIGIQNGTHWTNDQGNQMFDFHTIETKSSAFNTRDERLTSSTLVKHDDEMLWGKNGMQENFLPYESSFADQEMETTPFDKTQRDSKSGYLNNLMMDSHRDATELKLIDPEKIFGHTTQFHPKHTLPGEKRKMCMLSPSLGQVRSCDQAEHPTSLSNDVTFNEGLFMEPSSPITNLSNLVAKIHPDHGNIMTGQRSVQMEGQVNEMPVKRRSHCVCPNCLSGLNSVTENVQQRSHSCHYPGCGKVYGKTSHLKAHLRWHKGERPFVCSWNTGLRQCGKSFTRSDELQRHLRIHTKEKSFLCSICNKAFGRSDHLSKHLKTHDNERKKANQHKSIEENCLNSSTKLLQVDDNDGDGVNAKN